MKLTPAGRIDCTSSSTRFLPRASQFGFQFVSLVEMVFNGALGATADENDVGDARIHRLFNRILNQRLVDDGEHFFRAGFGCGQKSGAQAGDGEYGFFSFCMSLPENPFGLQIQMVLLVIVIRRQQSQ